jgi:hypothetical protein
LERVCLFAYFALERFPIERGELRANFALLFHI